MKKLLALLLAVAIVMTMSIPAFAEEVDEIVDDHSGSATATDKEPSAEIGVYGNYLERLDSEKILSVVVSWTDMYFEYAKSQQGTWQPESHTYIGAKTDGAWLNDTATITIANHSNMAVTANLAFTANADGVTGTLSKPSVELATAVDTTVENAPKDNVTFTIGGSITEGTTDLGKITVSLDADETEGGTNTPEDGGNDEPAVEKLDLSAMSVDDYEAAIEEYLAKIDPTQVGGVTLNLNLPATTSTKMGNKICDALYDYYEGDNSKKCDVVLYGVQTIVEKTFLFTGSGLKSLRFPDATQIDSEAFSDCFGQLETLIFDKVTSIGNKALEVQYSAENCFVLKNLIFKSVVKSCSGSWIYDGSGVTLTLNANQSYTNDWPGYPTYFEGESSDYPNGAFGNCYNWAKVQKG